MPVTSTLPGLLSVNVADWVVPRWTSPKETLVGLTTRVAWSPVQVSDTSNVRVLDASDVISNIPSGWPCTDGLHAMFQVAVALCARVTVLGPETV
jgi:hypothetical protein